MTTKSSLHPHQAAALPGPKNGEIFAYLAESPKLPEEANALVVAAVLGLCKKNNVPFNRVEVFSKHDVEDFDAQAGAAYDQLLETLGFPVTADILCTQMALPHTDDDFGGLAFVSKVLHTGSVPYRFSAHAFNGVPRKERIGHLQEVMPWSQKSRHLVTNDLLVFDPLNLHTATPLRLVPDAMLIMLQHEASLVTPAHHEALLRKYPRHVYDRDEDGDDEDYRLHNLPSSGTPYLKSRERIETIFLSSINRSREMHRQENAEIAASKLPKARRPKPLPPFNVDWEWGTYISEMVGQGSAPREAMAWKCPKIPA